MRANEKLRLALNSLSHITIYKVADTATAFSNQKMQNNKKKLSFHVSKFWLDKSMLILLNRNIFYPSHSEVSLAKKEYNGRMER